VTIIVPETSNDHTGDTRELPGEPSQCDGCRRLSYDLALVSTEVGTLDLCITCRKAVRR
jgi:hypothetical protein